MFKVVKMTKNETQSQDRVGGTVITERTPKQKALRKTILAVSFGGSVSSSVYLNFKHVYMSLTF